VTAPDPIRAALDAAGEAARIEACKPGCCGEGTGCEIGPCYCSTVAARAAIAAFLRALPPSDVMMQRYAPDGDLAGPHSTLTLAAAVEAAGEGRDDA